MNHLDSVKSDPNSPSVPEAILAQQEDLEDLEDEEEEVKNLDKTEEKSISNKTLSSTALFASFHLRKTNSLKRSITLPKNPFLVGNNDDMNSSNKKSKASGNNKNGKNETFSVRNFFHKVVSQIALPNVGGSTHNGHSKHRAKLDVSEEKLQLWKKRLEEGKVPGVIGIRNHGNTCFINAVLQCLNHTDLLAEYFVLDQYKSDLRRKRRIANLTHFKSRTASKGEVTEQLATLLKSLWSLQYDPEISVRFKSLVEKHASQYKGSSQHDAQEFLLWLLDQVHEDLNKATKRRYKMSKNQGEKQDDEQLAAESLANYMRCNNSFVMDVFQAQFRSSLTCPKCERQSNTFDPFLCVSLPIPLKQLMPVTVIVLYIDQCPRQVKLGLTIPIHETIAELRTALSTDTGIDVNQILLTEIGSLGFLKTLRDNQSVQVIKDLKEPLYCIETPTHNKLASDEEEGAFVILTWVNIFKEGPIEKRFGSPYTIQISRETLYIDLQKLLMKEMSSILHDDILISNQKVPLFKIRVLDGFTQDEEGSSKASAVYLDANTDLPMYVEAVEQAVNLCQVEPGSGPPHVKLILEWDMPAKSQVINDDSDVIEEHSSVKEVAEAPDESASVSLQECFELYTSAEKLGQGDAWFCPECNRKQEVVKRMGLWSVPDVLVIHLKRFKHGANASNKLSTMVEFPLEGFDMSPNVTKSNIQPEGNLPNGNATTVHGSGAAVAAASVENSGLKVLNALSPWRQPKRFATTRYRDHVYDLYAVCNHHGSDLQGGHYTAFCRNPTDDKWYCFDDVHTKVVAESEVVTNDAYILFYQRQSATSSSSASSSSSGSSIQEHWVFRMPDFTYKKKGGVVKVVKNTTNEHSLFKRNGEKYATMPTSTSKKDNNSSSTTLKENAEKAQSDVELNQVDTDDDETITQSVEKKFLAEGQASKATKNLKHEEEEEIARPPDKNDVD